MSLTHILWQWLPWINPQGSAVLSSASQHNPGPAAECEALEKALPHPQLPWCSKAVNSIST